MRTRCCTGVVCAMHESFKDLCYATPLPLDLKTRSDLRGFKLTKQPTQSRSCFFHTIQHVVKSRPLSISLSHTQKFIHKRIDTNSDPLSLIYTITVLFIYNNLLYTSKHFTLVYNMPERSMRGRHRDLCLKPSVTQPKQERQRNENNNNNNNKRIQNKKKMRNRGEKFEGPWGRREVENFNGEARDRRHSCGGGIVRGNLSAGLVSCGCRLTRMNLHRSRVAGVLADRRKRGRDMMANGMNEKERDSIMDTP